MNKRIKLIYFTGTGNSKRVFEVMKSIFEEKGYSSFINSITENNIVVTEDFDYIGISFPVYALSSPRIIKNFIKKLPINNQKQKVFIISTMGGKDEEGWALVETKKIFEKKGYNVVGIDSIVMPDNWVALGNPPSKDDAEKVLLSGENHAREIANKIISEIHFKKEFVWPKYGKATSKFLCFGFKNFGIKYLWLAFKTNKKCTSCGLCSEICPTKAIKVINKKPKWSNKCEQCMRCMNLCPQNAIEQLESMGKGSLKNRYHEPHFKPLQN